MPKCIITGQEGSGGGGSGGGATGYPPGNVIDLKVTGAANGKIHLTWTDPNNLVVEGVNLMEWSGTKVVYKLGSFPEKDSDGTVAANNIIRNAYSVTPLTISGLETGETYYIKLFPYSTAGVTNSTKGSNEVLANVAEHAPDPITNLTLKAVGNNKAYLTWSDPADTVTNGTTLSTWQSTTLVAKAGSAPGAIDDGIALISTTRNQYATTPIALTGLENNTAYYFKTFSTNTDGISNKTNATVSGTPVSVYLGNVTSATIATDTTNGGGKLVLKWTDPADVTTNGVTTAVWAGTKVVRKTGSYPTSVTDGTLVIDSTVKNQYAAGYVDSGLINDTTYFYGLFPYSDEGLVTIDNANRLTETPTDWVFEFENSTWSDVYDLCKLAQGGSIDIKDFISIGDTKSMKLSSAMLGESTKIMEVIDINKDCPGSITWQTKDSFYDYTTFGSSNNLWIGSTARTLCQEFYNKCEAKNYIRTVSKGTNSTWNTSSLVYNDETVFLPSMHEVGLGSYDYSPKTAEYTQGVSSPYAKYVDNTSRIKKRGDNGTAAYIWWVRSWSSYSSAGVSYVTGSGAGNGTSCNSGRYLPPAFVIG